MIDDLTFDLIMDEEKKKESRKNIIGFQIYKYSAKYYMLCLCYCFENVSIK